MEDPNKKTKFEIELPEEFRENLRRSSSNLNNLLKQYDDRVIAKDVLLKILHYLTATEVYLICNMGYADAEFIKRKRIIPLLIERDFGTEQLRTLENALLKPGKGLECKFVERLDTINYPRMYLLCELIQNKALDGLDCVYKVDEREPLWFATLFTKTFTPKFARSRNAKYSGRCVKEGNAFLKICIEVPDDRLDISDYVNIHLDKDVIFLVLFRIFYRLLSIPGIYLEIRHDLTTKGKKYTNLYLKEKI